jgi:hypothetical protein
MKKYQKTIKCPKCGTGNILTARELVSGEIRFNVDPTRIRCRNCGHNLRHIDLPYPFGNEELFE